MSAAFLEKMLIFAICYVSPVLTTLKTVRYTDRIKGIR
jgi:hypothetical protein